MFGLFDTKDKLFQIGIRVVTMILCMIVLGSETSVSVITANYRGSAKSLVAQEPLEIESYPTFEFYCLLFLLGIILLLLITTDN
jgi:hypothetical protein